MSRLQTAFPEGARFGRDDQGELVMWVDPPAGTALEKLGPVPVQSWVDNFTIAGTDYEVIQDGWGQVITAVLQLPTSGMSNGLSVGRRFILNRHEDVSTVSGTGVVAHGIQWPDGTVSMRWSVPGLPPGFACWDSIEAVQAVHGHHGKTEVEWID